PVEPGVRLETGPRVRGRRVDDARALPGRVQAAAPGRWTCDRPGLPAARNRSRRPTEQPRREPAMIEYELDPAESILYVRPKGALAKSDFEQLTKAVDPHIEAKGDLAGLIIEARAFPGWESLGAMAAHFRFLRDHHTRIKKVAVVTDAALGT